MACLAICGIMAGCSQLLIDDTDNNTVPKDLRVPIYVPVLIAFLLVLIFSCFNTYTQYFFENRPSVPATDLTFAYFMLLMIVF